MYPYTYSIKYSYTLYFDTLKLIGLYLSLYTWNIAICSMEYVHNILQ